MIPASVMKGLIKLQAFKTSTQVFSCEICEISRTPMLKNICVVNNHNITRINKDEKLTGNSKSQQDFLYHLVEFSKTVFKTKMGSRREYPNTNFEDEGKFPLPTFICSFRFIFQFQKYTRG